MIHFSHNFVHAEFSRQIQNLDSNKSVFFKVRTTANLMPKDPNLPNRLNMRACLEQMNSCDIFSIVQTTKHTQLLETQEYLISTDNFIVEIDNLMNVTASPRLTLLYWSVNLSGNIKSSIAPGVKMLPVTIMTTVMIVTGNIVTPDVTLVLHLE